MISIATSILACICLVLGGAVAFYCLVVACRTKKRETAVNRRTARIVGTAAEYGSVVYRELKDPATRAAEIRKIAGEVGGVLKAGGVKLADQFEMTDPAKATS